MATEMYKKEKQFAKLLLELEDKYRDYFLRKVAKGKGGRDRISNHYFIRKEGDNSGADLLWLDGSDLRSDIKEEVQKIYNQIFNR
jgi:hypothetical protein